VPTIFSLKKMENYMPQIKLPDSQIKYFEKPISVHEVALSIAPSLAKAAIAGFVNDNLVDTSFLIENDCCLTIITKKENKALEILRHSTAHLLAQAVKSLFPSAQVTIAFFRHGTEFNFLH